MTSSTLWPIESVPLADRTLQAIRSAIISGELAAHAPLKDRQLAEQLGVSRTPVREALHRLEAAGLVESRGRAGWMVSAFTEQDVRELFQLRKLVEPVGLTELEERRDPQLLASLTAYFGDYGHPIPADRYPAYFAHDDAFHHAIVQCSSNRRIHNIYEVLESHINRGRFFLYGAAPGRVDETLDEHRAIVGALAEGDFARARKELIHHLDTGEELMIRQLRQRANDEVAAASTV